MPEEYILCGSGAAELIYAFADAVRPQRAAELAPTFAEYSLALARTGCAVARYTLSEKNDFAPDGGILNFLRETRPEVFFLCNPNNPTGRLADGALLKEILALCEKLGTYLFADECFLDLTDGGESLKPFLTRCPRLFILKAFTKSYGHGGRPARLRSLRGRIAAARDVRDRAAVERLHACAGGGRRGAGGDGIS